MAKFHKFFHAFKRWHSLIFFPFYAAEVQKYWVIFFKLNFKNKVWFLHWIEFDSVTGWCISFLVLLQCMYVKKHKHLSMLGHLLANKQYINLSFSGYLISIYVNYYFNNTCLHIYNYIIFFISLTGCKLNKDDWKIHGFKGNYLISILLLFSIFL